MHMHVLFLRSPGTRSCGFRPSASVLRERRSLLAANFEKLGHMSRAIIHLLRHGEVYNPDRVLYGRLPEFHLSELGRRMADLAAASFARRAAEGANIVYLVSSPLIRARETADAVAQALNLGIATDERIIEGGNHFEGLSNVKTQLRNPRHWPYMVNPLRPSWGEPYTQMVARMAAAVRDARRYALELGGDDAEAVLVGHQLPIWVTRRSAEGRRLWHDPRRRECSLASVTSIQFEGDRIAGIRYSEPAAELLPGAASVPGA